MWLEIRKAVLFQTLPKQAPRLLFRASARSASLQRGVTARSWELGAGARGVRVTWEAPGLGQGHRARRARRLPWGDRRGPAALVLTPTHLLRPVSQAALPHPPLATPTPARPHGARPSASSLSALCQAERLVPAGHDASVQQALPAGQRAEPGRVCVACSAVQGPRAGVSSSASEPTCRSQGVGWPELSPLDASRLPGRDGLSHLKRAALAAAFCLHNMKALCEPSDFQRRDEGRS